MTIHVTWALLWAFLGWFALMSFCAGFLKAIGSDLGAAYKRRRALRRARRGQSTP